MNEVSFVFTFFFFGNSLSFYWDFWHFIEDILLEIVVDLMSAFVLPVMCISDELVVRRIATGALLNMFLVPRESHCFSIIYDPVVLYPAANDRLFVAIMFISYTFVLVCNL